MFPETENWVTSGDESVVNFVIACHRLTGFSRIIRVGVNAKI